MKIYREVIFDKDDNVSYEDSYEYQGEIAQCGSGGGATSTTEVPPYIADIHADWLTQGADAYSLDPGTVGSAEKHSIDISVVEAMNTAMADDNVYDNLSDILFNPFLTEGTHNSEKGRSPSLEGDSPLLYLRNDATTFQALVDGKDPDLFWEEALTKVLNNIGGSGDTRFGNASTIYTELNATLSTVITQAVSKAVTLHKQLSSNSLTDIDRVLSAASINMADLLTDAYPKALDAAATAIASTTISNAITAYDTGQIPVHLRAIGRFAGGMADINAVQSSAFVIGLALLEQNHQNDVNKYAADLKLQIYTDVYKEYLQHLVTLSLKYTDGYMTMVNGYLDSFKVSFLGYMDTWGARYGQARKTKDAAILQGIEIQSKSDEKEIQFAAIKTELNNNVNTMWMVAGKEFMDTLAQSKETSAKWDLEVFQYGANLLASQTGASSVTKPAKISQGQSALAGAFGAAAITSQVTKDPVTLAGAAIVGGIAGYLFN